VIRRIDVKAPRERTAAQLDDLIAREHRRVEKLTKARNRLQRQLERARMRYSVLKRLANDQARRAL
jgi:hypothetical protein